MRRENKGRERQREKVSRGRKRTMLPRIRARRRDSDIDYPEIRHPRHDLEMQAVRNAYLKSVCGAAVQRRRFPLHDERVDGFGQENRQGATSDKIAVAGDGRGLVVAIVVILDGITLLVVLVGVVRFLCTWRTRSTRLRLPRVTREIDRSSAIRPANPNGAVSAIPIRA